MMDKEIRRFDFEIRAEETDKEKRGGQLTGLPIVFDQATDWDGTKRPLTAAHWMTRT